MVDFESNFGVFNLQNIKIFKEQLVKRNFVLAFASIMRNKRMQSYGCDEIVRIVLMLLFQTISQLLFQWQNV